MDSTESFSKTSRSSLESGKTSRKISANLFKKPALAFA